MHIARYKHSKIYLVSFKNKEIYSIHRNIKKRNTLLFTLKTLVPITSLSFIISFISRLIINSSPNVNDEKQRSNLENTYMKIFTFHEPTLKKKIHGRSQVLQNYLLSRFHIRNHDNHHYNHHNNNHSNHNHNKSKVRENIRDWSPVSKFGCNLSWMQL